MIVLVTGTREAHRGVHGFTIRRTLDFVTHERTGPHALWHGDAEGVDRIAAAIAAELGWSVRAFPADWKAHSRAAGPIRNREMVAAGPHLCVGFPLILSSYDRESGTENCMKLAWRAGIPVLIKPLTL